VSSSVIRRSIRLRISSRVAVNSVFQSITRAVLIFLGIPLVALAYLALWLRHRMFPVLAGAADRS
jgi:ACR3 family arsenite efflux pump ArsB